MITKVFKTTKGKLPVSIPTLLNEVSLGQLMQMQATANMTDLDAISILSGIAVNELKDVKNLDDMQTFNQHVNLLAYQIKHLYTSDALPAQITFNLQNQKVVVKVLKNLSVEPAGAFMAARDLIGDAIAEHIKQHGEEGWRESFSPSLQVCAQVLGQYFYCRATGNKYDEHEAAEFYEEVKKLPVTDALPIARYFFLNYPNLSKLKTGFWQRLQLYWNRRQALRLLSRSVTLIP